MPSEQQAELDQLVVSVLKRDVLFVLYHLQRLEHGSINQLGESIWMRRIVRVDS